MEKNGENSIVSVNPKPTTYNEIVKTPRNRSRNGSKNIFKVALLMMRGRNRKSKVLPKDDESRSVWKKLVGSMRPLHLQSDQSPRHINGQMNSTTAPSENGDDGFESASEFAYSPSPTSIGYASAVGLNEMVQDEEKQKEEEEEEINVKEDIINGDGDDMIDEKAEEFIAQFYHQMKLQRMNTMDRRYREISLRSLGL